MMRAIVMAFALLLPDYRAPRLSDGSIIEVWCPPVPELEMDGEWVLVVVDGARLVIPNGGWMPRSWLKTMKWRSPKPKAAAGVECVEGDRK